MWNWIVKNKVVIIVGVISLVAGFLLNQWSSRMSEQRIIESIVAHIEKNKARRHERTQES